jgi:hypothetical protein
MNTLGNVTKSIFHQGPERHKLHVEFEASGTIHRGQPVKLTSDGKVEAAAAGDDAALIIGISIHEEEGAYPGYVTVAMKGYAVISCVAAEAIDAGPCVYAGFTNAYAYTGTHRQLAGHNLIGNITGAAAAQVETVTVTGTGGTAQVTMGGVTRTTTFDTNIATTLDNFKAAFEDDYAAVGITLTETATTLVFTAATAGVPFTAGAAENLTGDLAGSVAHTTASAAAGAAAAQFGWALHNAAANTAVMVAVSA